MLEKLKYKISMTKLMVKLGVVAHATDILATWEDHRFQITLGYITRPCLKNQNKTKQKN
jgi:hypothetical protein